MDGMNSPWPVDGPTARDRLESLTTALLAEMEGPVPGVADDPPDGWTESVDGRGVYLRRTADRPAATRSVPAATDARPDAWYIHGLAGSSTNWTALAGLLSDRATGYLVDLPGHGRSDPPPRGHYRLPGDAELVATLIRRRSRGPVHLLANSMGAIVATAIAARHPELVATLTLISPAVPDLRLTGDRGASPMLALVLLPGTTGPALRRLDAISPARRARGMGELCYGDPSLLTDDDYAVAAAELSWRQGLPWAHSATIGSLRGLLRSYLFRRSSFWRQAAQVRAPVLVIWGTRDKLVDVALAPRTAAAFARSSLLVVRGVGHTAQMEAPLVTARAVARLWENPGAPHRSVTGPVATSFP